MQTSNGFKDMLNLKRAAAYLGIHPDTLKKLLRKKQKKSLPHYRMGIKRFFKPEDLDSWIESFKVE